MAISFVRTIILYIIVVAGMRFMGKRQIGELQPSELVVAILISELAAIPMQETGIPLVSGVIPILTLIAAEIILSAITLSSMKFRHIITGKPSILIKNGIIDQHEMRRNRITLDDLMEELRLAGYASIDEIGFAVLETNGKLSVFPTAQNKPTTASMINYNAPDGGLPTALICDGSLSLKALYATGRNMEWLQNQIKEKNIELENVFLMTVDSLGKTIIIPKEKS